MFPSLQKESHFFKNFRIICKDALIPTLFPSLYGHIIVTKNELTQDIPFR